MKKTILASFLLATLATANINAKAFASAGPETEQTFKYVITYITETIGNCKITYKITTKYFLWIALYSSKYEVARICSGQGGGGQDGGN